MNPNMNTETFSLLDRLVTLPEISEIGFTEKGVAGLKALVSGRVSSDKWSYPMLSFIFELAHLSNATENEYRVLREFSNHNNTWAVLNTPDPDWTP